MAQTMGIDLMRTFVYDQIPNMLPIVIKHVVLKVSRGGGRRPCPCVSDVAPLAAAVVVGRAQDPQLLEAGLARAPA